MATENHDELLWAIDEESAELDRRHSFYGLLFISKHFVLWHSLFCLHYTPNHNFCTPTSCHVLGRGWGLFTGGVHWQLIVSREGQKSTVWWLTINTVHCWSLGGINSQQRGSTINSEPINNQQSTERVNNQQ